MAIKQEYTKWVKKPGQKGYVIDTRTGKKVTGGIKLVADTTKAKAGQTQTYKKGRGQAVAKKPSGRGGGQMPGSSKTSGGGSTGSGASDTKTPPPSTGKTKTGAGRKYEEKKASMKPGSRPRSPSTSKPVLLGGNQKSAWTQMTERWSSMTPAQRKAAAKAAAKSRQPSPVSVKGLSNITQTQAKRLLDRFDRGLENLSSAQRTILRRIIEGR